MKRIKTAYLILLAFCACGACTNLDESVYDKVLSDNYYNSRQDVINSVFRPFEHVFESVQSSFRVQEMSADHFITPTRGTWWYDGGRHERFHRHEWNDLGEAYNNWSACWTSMYAGIGQCNLVLDMLAGEDRNRFGISEEEWNHFIGQDKAMRAFCYINLLDSFRNIILISTADEAVINQPEAKKQVPPREVFDFIESELLDGLQTLKAKPSLGGNGLMQGQFTKAAAAALLVRLYLNAEVWVGEPMYDKCIDMCQRIEDGEFGPYSLSQDWSAPFDWNNETCDEVIFAFPAAYGYTYWHTQNDSRTIYGRGMPYGCQYYLGIEGGGTRNPQYALTPSYNNSNPRQLFPYKLGMVSQKFEKYAGDIRYKQYKNLTANSREGMFFLEGYVEGKDGAHAKEPYGTYELYLVDQVGRFEGGAPTGTITSAVGRESTLGNGDFNSGLYCMKYPFYAYNGGYYCASDYTVIRYAEVLYAKAECLLRQGRDSEAARVLNSVRKRNYTTFGANIAYKPEGNIELDMDEMLDEWGREVLMEGRRRIDLIRFGRFQDEWWDKPAEPDNHTNIMPLGRTVLEQNPYLKQNPGYPDIDR